MTSDRNTDTGRIEGRRRKDAAHDVLSEHRAQRIVEGRRAFLRALLKSGKATADDVQAVLTIPDGVDPVYLGAVPKAFIKLNIISRDGFAVSTRPAAHARPVTVWKLIDRQAAEKWLSEHPETEPQTSPNVSIPTHQPALPGIEQ